VVSWPRVRFPFYGLGARGLLRLIAAHDPDIVVSTYPERSKTKNARRDPRVSLCILSDSWDGPYVHIDGTATVLDMPEAADGLVEYFRCIAGEHSDWDEYREAMRVQDKSLISMRIERWGPIATGGFPPRLAD